MDDVTFGVIVSAPMLAAAFILGVTGLITSKYQKANH